MKDGFFDENVYRKFNEAVSKTSCSVEQFARNVANLASQGIPLNEILK
ncbi:TPA: hypothetical protein TZ201_001710 [Streptococcus suis]|nr:hypothetical protein [Streptococcus suis]NRG54224.1 hypothetical protein [Streptococcus suis]HEL2491949.1 hypothetical protein [Streptococcus suis]